MKRPASLIAAAIGAMLLVAALPALAADKVEYQVVSLDVNGSPSAYRDYGSYYAVMQVFAQYSLSSDGSSVAYAKRNGTQTAPDYVPMAPSEFCNNNGGCRDIYVHDLATGQSVALTQHTEWSGDANSSPYTGFGVGDWGISADHTKFVQEWNCWVVTFGDGTVCTGGLTEPAVVWVDSTTGETLVLNVRPDGSMAKSSNNTGSQYLSMSADGDTVVFASHDFDGLAPRGEQCLVWDCVAILGDLGIYVWRRGQGVEWITNTGGVYPANGFGSLEIGSFPPSVSGDGRYVSFSVFARDYNPDPVEYHSFVVRYDLETGTSDVVATAPAGNTFGRLATSYDGSRAVVATFSATFRGAEGLSLIDIPAGGLTLFADLGRFPCSDISITPDGTAAACDRNNFGPPVIVDLSTGALHDFATAADGFGELGYEGPYIGVDGRTAVWAGQRLSDPDHVFGAVQVRVATLTDDPAIPPLPDFTDVPTGSWMTEPVRWLRESKLTTGCTLTEFCPNREMPREQLVTFLYRYRGSPASGGPNPFIDVAAGRYYTTAIDWAYNTKLTTGISDQLFGTGRPVTRAEAVTFLWRDAGSPTPAGPAAFIDVPLGRFYSLAVAWASDNMITTGYGDGRFGPDDPVTRAQFAAFLYRYDALP